MSYDRALRTLRFEETDCAATWSGWIVSAGFLEHVTGRRFWDDPRGVAFEAYRKLDVDIIIQGVYLPASPEEWRRHTDETLVGAGKFGSPEDVLHYIDALPDPVTMEKQVDLEAQIEGVANAYAKFQDECGPDVFGLPSGSTARFTWYSEFGYESYLSAIALYPDAMRKLFEHSGEQARLSNTARAQLVKEGKLPGVFFTGQDICGARGPMISPDALRRLYYPNVRRALEPLVEAGAEIIWHSDGYIIPMVDDLIACGVTGFQGFQEETGFDISEIAKRTTRTGRKPLLLAGLSVGTVLPFGTVADVEREVERIVAAVGGGGGLAIGTANTAGPDCPNANLEALYRHAHEVKNQP